MNRSRPVLAAAALLLAAVVPTGATELLQLLLPWRGAGAADLLADAAGAAAWPAWRRSGFTPRPATDP